MKKEKIEEVSKIDQLQNDGRRWNSQVKKYASLLEPVNNYSNRLNPGTFFSSESYDDAKINNNSTASIALMER